MRVNLRKWTKPLVSAKRNTTYLFGGEIHFVSRFLCVLDPSFNEWGEYEVLLQVA